MEGITWQLFAKKVRIYPSAMRLLGLGALNMENSRGFAFLDPDEHEDFFPL